MKDTLIKALLAAGSFQKENFNKAHHVEEKESISSIVTEVDFLCDKIIVDIIRQEFPRHNILTEESGFTNNHSHYTWVIDPLDGTSNFAAAIPWFGVLIALYENGQPIMAGAYLPMEDSLYYAEKAKGAWVNGQRLCIENVELKQSLVGFAIDYSEDAILIKQGMNMYQSLVQHARNIRCTNSLLDFMMVADGRLGATLNFHTKIWDIAAPLLIIKEAGGLFKHLSGDEIECCPDEKASSINFSVMAGCSSVLIDIEKLQTSHDNNHKLLKI